MRVGQVSQRREHHFFFFSSCSFSLSAFSDSSSFDKIASCLLIVSKEILLSIKEIKHFWLINKASPDGKVPTHLLDRLKKTESLHLEKNPLKGNLSKLDTNESPMQSNNSRKKLNIPTDDLYISFERLLLEEDD